MDKTYSHNDINQFFTQFKELPDSFNIEKVHQLINNPNAQAMHTVKLNHKPFKFIIMTSAFVAGVASLLLWMTPRQTSEINNISITNSDKNDNLISFNDNNETKENHKRNETSVLKELSDTSIDGQKYIISLSDEELQKLGFMTDETGLFYKNLFMGKKACFHSRWESNRGEMTNIISFENPKNKKEIFTNYDFYPVSVSNILYTPREFKRKDFVSMNDTLLPVLIKKDQLKCGNENIIIWFKISDNLFDNLPSRYKALRNEFEEIRNLKRQYKITDLVKYEAKNITEGLRLIQLSKPELQKLGFIFKDSSLNFDTPLFEINLYEGKGQGITIHEFDGNAELKADNIQLYEGNKNVDVLKRNQTKLVYLTNEIGEQNVAWTGPNDDKDKNTIEYFQKKSQLLIPVYISKNDYPEYLFQDQIFWFEPSTALFDLLPDLIGEQLRREYNYITGNAEGKEKKVATCIYFEVCKSTMDVENFNIYPNPANTFATIDFTLPESTKGKITLVSISGIEIKSLVSRTSLAQGNNSFPVDVSDVLPGIYMVLLSTDNGFKTQRLIIK